MKLVISCALLLAYAAYGENMCSYKGYQLLKVTPKTERQLQFIKEMARSELLAHGEFWMRPSIPGIPVLIMAKQDVIRIMDVELSRKNMTSAIHVDDLSEFIGSYGSEKSLVKFSRGLSVEKFKIDTYHDLDEIEALYDGLLREFPLWVTKLSLGSTYEGRNLWVLKLGKHEEKVKQGFYIECGIHPREWITTAVCLHLLVNFLTKVRQNDTIYIEMLSKYDWYLLPAANPDGYVYTWTTDRFWRKNRSLPPQCKQFCSQSKSVWNTSVPAVCKGCCRGVDLNRNWAVQWGVTDSCPHPCCLTYGGGSAMSEPEVRAMADFLYKNRRKMLAFLAVHAYSQMWMFPYSYKKGELPPNADILSKISREVVEAIKQTHGRTYQMGAAFQIMYESSGTSMDWARNNSNIPYSFSIELRPSHLRTFELPAFCLPAEEIRATSDELFAAVHTLYTSISAHESSKTEQSENIEMDKTTARVNKGPKMGFDPILYCSFLLVSYWVK